MTAIAADLVTGRNRKDRSCLTAQTKAKPCGTHARRCVLSALVTNIADTHQRPERHTHRRLRDDSFPVQSQSLQDCASFVSSSRNSNMRTLRSSLHARSSSMSARAKQKRKLGQKGRLNVQSTAENKNCNSTQKNPASEILSTAVLINSRKLDPHQITNISDLIYSKNEKICTTHFCNHFRADGTQRQRAWGLWWSNNPSIAVDIGGLGSSTFGKMRRN